MKETAVYQDSSQSVEHRIEDLITRMSLAEKIGQMTQPENDSITPDEVAENLIGSVLCGGDGGPYINDPAHWAAFTARYQQAALGTRLGIPLLYGIDAVHGHSKVVGATVFPQNIAFGAAGSHDLAEKAGRATASERAATGIRWELAP